MRVLLATEGPSDEIVAQRLIHHALDSSIIECKKFVARGFQVVKRSVDAIVRAAHFGHYDLLAIHFDLNNTVQPGFASVSESVRWQEIDTAARQILANLPHAHRDRDLQIALITPCQATDAWLAWARENKSGKQWERRSRHELKRKLFGNPPRKVVEKADTLGAELVAQMDANEDWPQSLRDSLDAIAVATR